MILTAVAAVEAASNSRTSTSTGPRQEWSQNTRSWICPQDSGPRWTDRERRQEKDVSFWNRCPPQCRLCESKKDWRACETCIYYVYESDEGLTFCLISLNVYILTQPLHYWQQYGTNERRQWIKLMSKSNSIINSVKENISQAPFDEQLVYVWVSIIVLINCVIRWCYLLC